MILAVAVLNGVIGFIQEGRAEKALEGIARMLSAAAAVRRDGDWQVVPAEDLAPGDLIRVRAGDRVPADARLLEAANLQVEESAVTGESVGATKGDARWRPARGWATGPAWCSPRRSSPPAKASPW